MNVLITGANGFLGKNLSLALKARNHCIFEYDIQTPKEQLDSFVENAGFVVHLAGVNRTISKDEFYQGNADFTVLLAEKLRNKKNRCPIIFSSSIQALLDNDYGQSKKMAEDFLFSFQKDFGNKTYIYRLSNLFGKWSKPNYNSVVATFCYNISHDLPIVVNNPMIDIPLVYIDDVVNEFIDLIEGKKQVDSQMINQVHPIYPITVGNLANLIQSFKEMRSNLSLPNTGDSFVRKLYATYLSYLEPNDFAHTLKMNQDSRGSFTEFLKTANNGQISINVTKPGITKGNHYHNTKNEKFLVVSGNALIKFRKIGSENIISYQVNNEKMEVIEIPPGYTHSITNIGSFELVTVMWASEPFDKDNPDTFFLEV